MLCLLRIVDGFGKNFFQPVLMADCVCKVLVCESDWYCLALPVIASCSVLIWLDRR